MGPTRELAKTLKRHSPYAMGCGNSEPFEMRRLHADNQLGLRRSSEAGKRSGVGRLE
jgi:hypothetical protein